MFIECKRCHGSGYLGMHGSNDHADVCCDGGKFICDSCDCDITETDNLDRDGTHYCEECQKDIDEEGTE